MNDTLFSTASLAATVGWLLVPALPITFLFGPLGLGIYLLLRTAAGRTPA